MVSSSTQLDTTSLFQRYLEVRRFTESLCDPLEPEDCVIQSMPDVSPTRWHLAHTTWFFETFILSRVIEDYVPCDPAFEYLFNSYYNTVGEPFPRARRGLLSRPTVVEVFDYRRTVDEQMERALSDHESKDEDELLGLVEIGLHHEQQHQELIVTDIKHVLSCNPLHPAYHAAASSPPEPPVPLCWKRFDEGLRWIGHDGEGFAFDNESPRHRRFNESYSLATRSTTNAEYQEFIDAGGYGRPELWLSEGWHTVSKMGWRSPLYWVRQDDRWWQFTLAGLVPINPSEPVCHVSYFEADAFARWAEARLPTETEWEVAAEKQAVEGNFVEDGVFHPETARGQFDPEAPTQFYGDVWEWTSSPYTPYPGYAPPDGSLGEYNGKFMCNQFVLRGGSCATSQSHVRPTYRNFFPPDARWQFAGFRLAR